MGSENRTASARRSLIEALIGVFLIAISVCPFENRELSTRLWLAGLGTWFASWILFRSRFLLSTATFFHFAVILAFALRAAMSHGQLTDWYFLQAVLQWLVVLWLTARQTQDPWAPSLFLAVSFLSPLQFFLLNTEPFAGLGLWSLPLIRALWLLAGSRKDRRIPFPLIPLLFLALCLLSIPFSVYARHNIQFLLLNAACVALYYCISSHGGRVSAVLTAGYLFLAVLAGGFVSFKEAFLVLHTSPRSLLIPLSIVANGDDLAPWLITISCILLWSGLKSRSQAFVAFLFVTLAGLSVFAFLTQSRGAWVGYGVFVALLLYFRAGRSAVRRSDGVWRIVMAVVLLLFVLVIPLRSRRLLHPFDADAWHHRFASWSVGLREMATHPVFGIGWLNSFTQVGIVPPDPGGMDPQTLPSAAISQTRSAVLDLSAAIGFPATLLFFWFLVSHIRRESAVLAAGLCAILVHCLFAGSCLSITNYPHLWVLAGLLAAGANKMHREASLHTSWVKASLIVLLLFAGILPLIQDHLLLEASFYHKNNQDGTAVKRLILARWLAPLDVLPLQRLKDVYFSQEQPEPARNVLLQMLALNKGYAPYYADLGRIARYQNDDTLSRKLLLEAVRLDPWNELSGDAYSPLAEVSRKTGDRPDFERYMGRAFITRQSEERDFEALSLAHSVSEEQLFSSAMRALERSQGEERITQTLYLYYNLIRIRKGGLAQRLLETTLARKNLLSRGSVDYFANLLARQYASVDYSLGIGTLVQSASPPLGQLLEARLDIIDGEYEDAGKILRETSGQYDYGETADIREALYQRANQHGLLVVHYRLIEQLNLLSRSSTWQGRIATTFLQDRQLEGAAVCYHRLAQYDTSDPLPYWREARLWWLTFHLDRARRANRCAQQLIDPSWFTQNLYRSVMDPAPFWDGMGITHAALPNELGGLTWRAGFLAHPPTTIAFPEERRFQRIDSNVAIIADYWYEASDGVTLETTGEQGESGRLLLDAAHQVSQRGWNPLVWTSNNGPQYIRLTSSPNANPAFDWAFWSIQHAE